MKTNNLYFLLAFLFSLSATSQIINIPDANLKNVLLNDNVVDNTGGITGQFDVDLNNDGEIQLSEAQSVTGLFIPWNTNITSLEGLQFFTNLVRLHVRYNTVSFIPNLTATNLEDLNIEQSSLSTIDVSGLPNLKTLDLTNNNLSSLSVNAQSQLEFLYVSNNNLNALDISQNPLLIGLSAGNNPITFMDLSSNPLIDDFTLNDTLITSLDLTNQLGFLGFDVSNTPLTLLTGLVNKNGFDFISINNTQLTSLTFDNIIGGAPDIAIENNPILANITLLNSQFLNFRINNNPNLTSITATNNDINGIDFDSNGLISIDFEGNKEMGLLRITNEVNLVDFNLNNTRLQWSLDISNSTIENLFIKNGYVDTINFTGTNTIDYICADDNEILSLATTANNNGINNVNLNTYCTFAPGGATYDITGDVRIDADFNGCTTNDTRFTDFKFIVDDGTSTAVYFESPSYDYEIEVPEGNYTVTPEPIAPSLYNTLNSFNANFSMGAPDLVQDICLVPNGNEVDLAIVMDEILPARPGFVSGYRLICSNVGTAAINGTVFLNYNDNLVNYQGSTETPASNSNGNLSWNFNTLQPGEEHIINVDFRVNSPMDTPAVNGGDVLVYSGSIAAPSGINDVNTNNNTFEFAQTVVNSYDPNDITCLEGEMLDPANVGEDLHYKIRFENTGTASAINIVVKNEIDLTKLDINSFTPLTSSHPMRTRITNGNVVEFIFENINLDFNDATNDGYLIYKIKSLPSLQLGDAIGNQAGIYFDFNFPIITNDYMVTVAQTAGLNDANLNLVTLFPNPAKDAVTIRSQFDIKAIKIYDHLGRIVKMIALEGVSLEKTLNISNLKIGLYFIEVESISGKQSLKLVKE